MASWSTSYAPWVTMVVTATESEVNISNNTSKVTVVVQLKSSSTTRVWNDFSQSLSVTIDGSSAGSRTFTYSIYNKGTTTLATYSRVVTHGSDGTKTARIQVSASGGGESGSVDQTLGLTTIARASEVTVNPSTIHFGATTRIKINKKSSGFTSTVRVNWGTNNLTLWDKISWSEGDWVLPQSWSPSTATTGWGRVLVDTYNGTTLVGTKEIRLNGTVPNNSTFNPSANTPTIAEKNTLVSTNVAGIWVAGKSNIEYKATFATRVNATASKAVFEVVHNGKTHYHNASISGTTATYTDTPGSAGSHQVRLAITDSRGRTAYSAYTTYTVTAYVAPKLTSATANRKTTSATTLLINAKATSSSLSAKNVMTLKIYVKPTTTTSWGTVKYTTTSTTGAIALTNYEITGYAEASSFDIRFELYDELTSSVYSVTSVGTTKVLLDAYKDWGIGIGQMYDPAMGGALQVGGNIQTTGGFLGDIISRKLPVGTNLDNITNSGFYFAMTNADAATMTNTPTSSAFSLIVEQHAGVKQTSTVYMTNNVLTMTRNFYGGVWGNWVPFYESSSVVSNTYNSMLNGYSGSFTFKKISNLVYFDGWFQGVGTDRVTTDHNLFYPDKKYEPIAHLRIYGAPFGGSTSNPEIHGAVLRIESGTIVVEKSSAKVVRHYVFGCYMTNNTNR